MKTYGTTYSLALPSRLPSLEAKERRWMEIDPLTEMKLTVQTDLSTVWEQAGVSMERGHVPPLAPGYVPVIYGLLETAGTGPNKLCGLNQGCIRWGLHLPSWAGPPPEMPTLCPNLAGTGVVHWGLVSALQCQHPKCWHAHPLQHMCNSAQLA